MTAQADTPAAVIVSHRPDTRDVPLGALKTQALIGAGRPPRPEPCTTVPSAMFNATI